MTIDFKEEDGFEALPNGDYQATVFDVEPTDKKNKNGDKGLNVQFRITGPTHVNRRVFECYWFGTKSLWRLKKLLVATDALDGSYTGAFDETTIGAKISGKPVTVTLGTEEYSGEDRNTVENVSAPKATAGLPF